MNNTNIILGPIISEKSMNDAANSRYYFKVLKSANKREIKKVIEEKFKVNVLKIATVTIKGRSARAGVKRLEFLKPSFKKAFVTVKSGQKISLFDAGSEGAK